VELDLERWVDICMARKRSAVRIPSDTLSSTATGQRPVPISKTRPLSCLCGNKLLISNVVSFFALSFSPLSHKLHRQVQLRFVAHFLICNQVAGKESNGDLLGSHKAIVKEVYLL
jgi:hypothetical protein